MPFKVESQVPWENNFIWNAALCRLFKVLGFKQWYFDWLIFNGHFFIDWTKLLFVYYVSCNILCGRTVSGECKKNLIWWQNLLKPKKRINFWKLFTIIANNRYLKIDLHHFITAFSNITAFQLKSERFKFLKKRLFGKR